MIRLSDVDLFRDPHIPVVAHRTLAFEATDSFAAEAVKVVFVVAGASQLRSSLGNTDIAKGDIVSIPEGTWFAASPFGYVNAVAVYVRSSFLRVQLDWFPRTNPLWHLLRTALGDRDAVQRLNIGAPAMDILSSKLHAVAALPPSPSQLLDVYARLASIFDDVGRLGGRTDLSRGNASIESPKIREEVTTAVRFLREELDHQWSVRKLAAAVSLSESQLARLFRRELGISPAAFLWRSRTEELARILATEKLSVAEAARRCGWATPSAASRAFRRRYGVTPSQFARGT